MPHPSIHRLPRLAAAFLGGAALWLSTPFLARADEALFGYIYTTDLLPKGHFELEQWVDGKFGKQNGSYSNLRFRSEIEYGFTDNFQGSLYINSRDVYASRDTLNRETGGEDVPANHDPSKRYSRYRFESVSSEFIYRFLSPYKSPFGLALYLEPAVGEGFYEMEAKLILQKNFLEDRLVWATNLTWEWEWKREEATFGAERGSPEAQRFWQHEMELEVTTGLSYRFAQNWSAGVELRNHEEFSKFQESAVEHSAFFVGPTLHYGGKRWWATLSVLAQLPLAQGYNQEQRDNISGGRIFGDEHEAVQARLRVGFNF